MKQPKRQLRTLDSKLAHMAVLTEDARCFLKSHRIKPAFRRELEMYLEACGALVECVHKTIVGEL